MSATADAYDHEEAAAPIAYGSKREIMYVDGKRLGARIYLRVPPLMRFKRKIQPQPDGCWLWVGPINNRGYGRFYLDGDVGLVYAHRWSYEQHVGPIPPGLVIDHLCRRPACVRPEHLEAVTVRENTVRGVGHGKYQRAKTHCPAGHPYDQENTRLKPRKTGGINRICRSCDRRRSLLAWRARRALGVTK